jgi:demethylmenaquinone methyltransferase / 2-methoxy-6-polyprenyl-1,4-benzoquinol methylase
MTSKTIWLEEQHREKVLNDPKSGQKKSFFGYHTVAEDEKTQWVLRHFNSVADWYDFMNTLLSFGIHYLWKRTAVNMMNLKKGDRIIDVCGGTGDLAVLAGRKIGAGGRVIIYDINKAMMDAGRKKQSVSGFGEKIRFVLGNAESISFPDNTFDAAMVGFGIRNVTRMERGFAEMYRVLKPGGTLMCLEFSKPAAPVFRWLYDFYSFHIMPLLGQLIVGSRQAYTHLPESIRTFPLPDKLSEILENIGFYHVSYRRLTNGIAVVHKGIKSR